MKYYKFLETKLNGVIREVSEFSEFRRNPETDFTRERKLGFTQTFNSVLTMGGGSLDTEILELFEYRTSKPSKSAFVQARHKILPEAFSHVFYEFSKELPRYKRHKGYHLLSVDGSSLNISRNPDDAETFCNQGEKQKGFNEIELIAMYDLLNNIYTDTILQGINHKDERGALVSMIPNIDVPSIVIGDRGYEGYNIFAHFEEVNQKYLIRAKDINSTGILSGFHLPDNEFDFTFTVNISNYQKKALKALPNYRFSPSCARFDFSNNDNPVYQLTFRVLRFKLKDDKYQCIITNLFDDFSIDDINHLYKMRWGIETSFRQLKYAIGLNHFHSKKKDSIIQEIYASLTLHNFCESVVQNAILITRANKHQYKINFTRAVQVCRKYLRFFNTILVEVESLICSFLSVVRNNRSFERKLKPKKFVSFVYRVS
jgi:hypothetical protein